jgi:hypothetical protein
MAATPGSRRDPRIWEDHMKHLFIGAVAALGLSTVPALAEFPEKDLQGIIQWGPAARPTW